MRKKLITISLSSILLFGCGASKVPSNDCCEPQAQSEHHEKALSGLLFGLITYAIFSVVKL